MRLLTIIFLAFSSMTFADFTLQSGKLVERQSMPSFSAQEHYSAIIDAYEKEQWRLLEKEALIVVKNFSSSPFARDASFYLGVAYFKKGDYDLANNQFTEYLTRQATPKFFEEAINYKFEIADGFRTGARKHFLGLQSLPKWTPAGSDAISIYDEVISALPHSDLAAHSLYGKAEILANRDDHRASIECYQTLIRRFPKHPLAIESYIGIGHVYYLQSQSEYPDPDYLDLADLNLSKFRKSFPGEEKLSVAYSNFAQMQELYASAFFDTARFYERTKKWGAAKIYYKKILACYPNSDIAKKSQMRLENVSSKISKLELKKTKK